MSATTSNHSERLLRRAEAAKYVVKTYNVPCSPHLALFSWQASRKTPLADANSDRQSTFQDEGVAVMLTRHTISVRGNDLYETPEVATLALLRAEPLPRTIWEPACGPGAIVQILRDAGHRVIATDLIDYCSPDQDHAGRDFLPERSAPDGVEMIVTNPPFKLAAQFAAHGLSLCPRVVMLLRLTFLKKHVGAMRSWTAPNSRSSRYCGHGSLSGPRHPAPNRQCGAARGYRLRSPLGVARLIPENPIPRWAATSLSCGSISGMLLGLPW
jgi:hypothetical protein